MELLGDFEHQGKSRAARPYVGYPPVSYVKKDMKPKKRVSNSELAVSSSDIASVHDALDYFKSLIGSAEGFSLKYVRNKDMKAALEVFEEVSTSHGLSAPDIESLIKVVLYNKLPKVVRLRVVKCLIPADIITENVVLTIVSSMCSNSVPLDMQCLLVQWLLIVYDNIDGPALSKLRSLYGFLFNMLDNSVLRPHLCHLLYRLTLKQQVRPFRVRALIDQSKLTSQNVRGPLTGLLLLYKHFQPHLVVMSYAISVKTFFRPLNRAWSAKVREVTCRNRPLVGVDPASVSNHPAQSWNRFQPAKRAKLALVPKEPSHLSSSREMRAGGKAQMISCSEIDSFSKLLAHIDRILLPSQIVSLLNDDVLKYLLVCNVDPSVPHRLQYWIQFNLIEELHYSPSADGSRLSELLQLVVKLTEFVQEGLPVCDQFLASFLPMWNGFRNQEHVLKLISRIRLRSFADLNEQFLEPLRRLFFMSSVYFKCQLLACWTELLVNWASVEYQRVCVNSQTAPDGSTFDSYSLFPSDADVDNVSAVDTINEFVKFVDKVVVVAFQVEKSNILLTYFALAFYNEASQLFTRYQVPTVIAPSPGFVYYCLFHRNAIALSEIVNIICQCRESYVALRHLRNSDGASSQLSNGDANNENKGHVPSSSGTVAQPLISKSALQRVTSSLNTYTIDICDILWRCWAFTDRQSEASCLRLLSRDAVDKLNLPYPNMALSMFMHRAMLGFARRFIDVTQAPDAAVQPASIKKHKQVYVEFLSRQHLNGIQRFVEMCIRRRSDVATTTT